MPDDKLRNEFLSAVEDIKRLYHSDLPIEERKMILAAQKELNRLQGLYAQANGEDSEENEDGESALSAEIRRHLEPLNLAEPGTPLVDLANSKYKWYRYDLVWSKDNRCGFLNANQQPLRSHENILVFGGPGEVQNAVYHPQWGKKTADCRRRKAADANSEQAASERDCVNPVTKIRKGGVYPSRPYLRKPSDGKRHPHSVLCYKNEFGLHPTQKPTALLEFLVQSYSSENDIVLDPFMGSGTTGIACALHNRRFIGIEKERKYFDIAVERMRKVGSRE